MALRDTEHWDAIYSRIPADQLSWYQPRSTMSLDLIRSSGVARDGRILDVGAGASLLADDLLALGHTSLCLVDLSATALEVTRQRLAGRSEVEYLVGDVASVDLGQVELWHDRALFHFFLDANDRARYVDAMFRSVRPGGYAVIAAFAEDGPESCSGLPTARYSVEELAASFAPQFTLQASRREIHVKPAGGEQAFNYVLIERRD